MEDILEIITTRRSVRNFEEKDIPEEMIEKVLESVKWAPTWANTQCHEIIVIKDKAIREDLKSITGKNPAAKAYTTAPILIAVCAKLKSSGYYKGEAPTKFGDWFMFDLGIVSQNICLTAHALGLGTVIVGMFDHDKVNRVLKVPEGYETVALIPMGYPVKIPSAPKRREISEFVHNNTF